MIDTEKIGKFQLFLEEIYTSACHLIKRLYNFESNCMKGSFKVERPSKRKLMKKCHKTAIF